jgi:predicted nucleotidyltransferase component of viral defense system
MISTAEIAKLAHRLGVGDRVIEKDYVLSWLLVAIAQSDLRDQLVFKDGTALRSAIIGLPLLEDLDFTLLADLPHDSVRDACSAVPAAGATSQPGLTLRSAELSV